MQSVAWRQDPEYYNDEVTRFRADIEPECLTINGQKHEEAYEEYRDPNLKAAAAQAAAILLRPDAQAANAPNTPSVVNTEDFIAQKNNR